MAKTYLRFFTLHSILEMLEDAAFEVKSIMRSPSGACWLRLLNRLSGDRFSELLVRQYFVVTIKREKAEGCQWSI